mmetsp:Transcript_85528/g.275945  ORF Transcript_85528/g.275945 Transcript_85528/m.275945 type:complete len:271 (+) Transcript_85528:333-1145(+)
MHRAMFTSMLAFIFRVSFQPPSSTTMQRGKAGGVEAASPTAPVATSTAAAAARRRASSAESSAAGREPAHGKSTTAPSAPPHVASAPAGPTRQRAGASPSQQVIPDAEVELVLGALASASSASRSSSRSRASCSSWPQTNRSAPNRSSNLAVFEARSRPSSEGWMSTATLVVSAASGSSAQAQKRRTSQHSGHLQSACSSLCEAPAAMCAFRLCGWLALLRIDVGLAHPCSRRVPACTGRGGPCASRRHHLRPCAIRVHTSGLQREGGRA